MLGYIIYGEGPKRPALDELTVAGGNFIALRMGLENRPNGPLALYRARQGARMLREAGSAPPFFRSISLIQPCLSVRGSCRSIRCP